MQFLPPALTALASYKQFILWTTEERDGKLIKLPVDYRTATKTDAHNPDVWVDAQTAIECAQAYGDGFGVGFVFTANDPFYFVDIDHCLQPDGSTWSPVANAIMGMLPGAAVEISQSGTGLHIFGKGVSPDHACKNIALGVEFYTEGRFVALTGKNIIGDAGVDSSTMLPGFVAAYVPPKAIFNAATWTTEPSEEWAGIDDDDKLITKMLASKSTASQFGNRASFADLWNRDIQALADAYTPDAADKGDYDESSADAGLAQHLAFWTGNDCERMLKLMFRSSLVRDKWKRDDYIKGTIIRAVSLQEKVHTGGKKKERPRVAVEPAAEPLGITTGPELRAGYQFLGITQQLDHFKGCIYVQDVHRVFTPSGAFLKSDQFNATYGGYVFQLEDNTSGKTTRKAWEAFTESQAILYPKAESSTFRPEIEQGALVLRDGRTLVNTYVPIVTPRKEGDVAPFLAHLAKVLPEQHDQDILLAYMAACIQHKGVKFQWAPLIQGVEGNGKTLFSRCVAFAIGERYTHMPPAEQLAEKFNAWLFNTLFIGVEDIYVPDHKSEIIEILKPMITNTRYAKRDMGVGQIMHDICCNFIFNSNHKDAVRKTRNDRRFAIFYSAQQNPDDIDRDGMGGDYFPGLYDWLKADGYAIVANYLENYEIPAARNPAGVCHRAPKTTSTDEAITASMGGVEQEILEAIEEGRPGFAGGWISSIAIDKLLDDMRAARIIPRNKRREMLHIMGYEWHPGLKDGRVNNVTMVDGGKPRLFIKAGHPALQLTGPAEIAKAYQNAQTAPIGQTAAVTAFTKHTKSELDK